MHATTAQRYAIDRTLRGMPHVMPQRHRVTLTVAERTYMDVMDTAAILNASDGEWIDDRSEYMAAGARSGQQSNGRERAGERPWTNGARTFGTGRTGFGRFLGVHKVTTADGIQWTALAPAARGAVRDQGADGQGTGAYRWPNGAVLAGYARSFSGRKRTHASNADRQRAYRAASRAKRTLAEQYGWTNEALQGKGLAEVEALLLAERDADTAGDRADRMARQTERVAE